MLVKVLCDVYWLLMLVKVLCDVYWWLMLAKVCLIEHCVMFTDD